jgi:hypothetical protein
MPRDPGVTFVLFIVGVVALCAVAYLVLLAARWNANRVRYVAPERGWREVPQNDPRFLAVSRGEINFETPDPPRSVAETEQEKITFAETYAADVVARLILAGEIDLTKTVKIGFEAKSGAKYQKYSGLVKAAQERQRQPQFPTLAAQQRPSVVER